MRSAQRGHFARHYLEMVVAMFVGMAVLWALTSVVTTVLGLKYSLTPEVAALKMAFDMSVGMVVWMRYRGHGWASTLEMVAAMFAPAVALAPLSWLGVIAGESLMLSTHILMLPLMFVVMLRRRAEYAR
jgi:flagellar biosynthetic protein FliP